MQKDTHAKAWYKNEALRDGIMEIKEPKTRFIKVRCTKCKNEQITYSKASSQVNCLVCGEVLVTPTGGKAQIDAAILEVLE